MNRREVLTTIAAAATAAGLPIAARAQLSQTGPARIQVGFPAGGVNDVVARALVARPGAGGEPVGIVENVPGAAGRIAITKVKAAAPDGSVVLFSHLAAMSLYPLIYKKLAYDPARDFVPVSSVGSIGFAITVSPSIVPDSVRSLTDLATWYRQNPKHATFGTGGQGTPMHFVGVRLAQSLGVELTHVPYKGGPPLIQDLLGGQLATAVTVIGETIPHVNSGKLRAIALTTPKRSPFLKDVPSASEAGAPGLVAEEYFGIFLPGGAAPTVIDRWQRIVREAVRTPDAEKVFATFAFEPRLVTGEEFAKMIEAEKKRWEPAVQASGFSIDE